MFILSAFACLLARYTQKLLDWFSQNLLEGGTWRQKKPLDFGSNSEHVKLWLWLHCLKWSKKKPGLSSNSRSSATGGIDRANQRVPLCQVSDPLWHGPTLSPTVRWVYSHTPHGRFYPACFIVAVLRHSSLGKGRYVLFWVIF